MYEYPEIGTYYWDARPNFGDAVNVPLLRHFAEIDPFWEPPQLAEVVCVGSVLQHLPEEGWPGVIAGAGFLTGDCSMDVSKARVLAVRGPETLQRLRGVRGEPLLADPALLASELVPVERNKTPIGLVPHWTDKDLYPREVARSYRAGYVQPKLIDPTQPPLDVIRQIGECSVIITSSLHGMIVADSFNIPRRAERHRLMDTSRYETDFKWHDYSASIGLPLEWGVKQTAEFETIWSKQYDLFNMLRGLIIYV